jgi:hypothetical protein
MILFLRVYTGYWPCTFYDDDDDDDDDDGGGGGGDDDDDDYYYYYYYQWPYSSVLETWSLLQFRNPAYSR